MRGYNFSGAKLTCPNLLPSKRDNFERVVVVAVHSKVFTAFADNTLISTHLINSRAHQHITFVDVPRPTCVIHSIQLRPSCTVTENANAPDDSGIRAEEAGCENRTLRRGACQVSLKIPLEKSTRTNGSTIVERVHYLLPRPIITIAFLPNPNAQANVSENKTRGSYIVHLRFFLPR